MLRLDGLAKRFGNVVALDGCSFEVAPGRVLGFLGPNGAGKTTAMRAVFGLVGLDRGAVTWGGASIDRAARLRFGYMPEERGLYPRMRVIDQVAYFGRLHGLARDPALAASRHLLTSLDLGDRLLDRVQDLSHGNQQRVQLAVALVHDPELLVLDEPFSGLDPVAAARLAGVLAERARAGAAVLFSSHQLDVVEHLCEDVVIVDRGRVVLSGRVEELRNASPRRYLEAVVRGAGTVWADGVPGAAVVSRKGDRVRLRLDGPYDLGELVARARVAGEVQEFSLTPPDLSEVFMEAVAR
ncbi:MAG: ATP-binding cassette domain-containing protein [Actinomycetota bacterium]